MSRFPWAWLGSLREWMKIKGKGECALPGGIVKLRLLSPVIWYRSSGEGLRTCIYYKFPSDADASGRGSQAENHWHGSVPSVQLSSVSQSCLTLCDPMACSMPGLPVHHQHLEFTQTHVHWVGDAIQPSHPLLSPSPPTFNLSQHQGNESVLHIKWPKDWSFGFSISPFNDHSGLISFRMDWL